MMKTLSQLTFMMLFFLGTLSGIAQEEDKGKECNTKYNLFSGDLKANNFDAAYENWIWCMDNCPKISVNLYKKGIKIAEHRYDNATEAEKPAALALVQRVYEQRLEYYPKDQGKVYSDYAVSMEKKGLTADEVFALYEKAFKAEPSKMGVKALLAYFYGVVDRNKDTDVQFIFDTYDDVVEGVNKKMDGYSTKLSAYNTKLDNGEELTSKEEKYKRAYENNLKALSQVQVGCDSRLTTIASCDNLVALYSKNLEANKNNGKWLQRAVSRMYNKDCTDADIYVSLVDAYQIASPSPEASVFYAGVLLKNGEKSKATQYFKQAIEQETDPNKKAKYLMKVANLSSKTDKVAARRAAKQAIALKPGYGQAYLLIADLYAKSANSCGSNVFEKKMTYVAALNYASRAKRLDPAISKVAQKYINNYRQQIPDKTMVFTSGMQAGTNYTIKCWINETVTIP